MGRCVRLDGAAQAILATGASVYRAGAAGDDTCTALRPVQCRCHGFVAPVEGSPGWVCCHGMQVLLARVCSVASPVAGQAPPIGALALAVMNGL